VIVEGSLPVTRDGSAHERPARRALSDAKGHLQKSALKLVGYLVAAYVVLKLVPTLKQALHSLEHVSWEWLLGAIALEVLSELGFVLAWGAIVDPQKLLDRDGRGRTDDDVAWAQLAGGLLLPGGAWGGVGVGALILHRFGVPNKLIAEREFNLSFLNTAVDALALIVFGIGLATRILAGERRLLLTVLPAAIAAAGIMLAALIARRANSYAERLQAKHPKIASALTTLASAVDDTKRLLFKRGDWTSVLGVLGYLGFDVLVLWTAFLAVHAHPFPGFGIVIMAYIIGALGGSIPLPASIGTVGGIAGMLILYGVAHNAAIAAVLLHQAIGLLVPLAGGGIAYAVLRRRFGPIIHAAGGSTGSRRRHRWRERLRRHA
jgi:uncharacterized membrane protein YbhN (UPF0104 family)